VLARNARLGGVEVDLVIRRGRLVVFVEVKTRRSRRFGPPEAAVDAAKQKRLLRAARAWIAENPGAAGRLRFDVVACHVSPGEPETWKIVHWEGAFTA